MVLPKLFQSQDLIRPLSQVELDERDGGAEHQHFSQEGGYALGPLKLPGAQAYY